MTRPDGDLPSRRIAVYGATGVTGALVVRRLIDRGLKVVAVGRSHERLVEQAFGPGCELRTARFDQPDELAAMLRDCSVLVSCAGPFTDVGRPVVEAALSAGVHYLDTTGEQSFIKWVYDTCDARAQRSELVLLPACAFEWAIGDAAADKAVRAGRRRIGVSYSAGGAGMTRGTKKSIVRVAAARNYAYAGGRLVARPVGGGGARRFRFPDGSERQGVFVPGGEVLSIPKRHDVDDVETFVTLGSWTRVLSTLAPLLRPTLRVVGTPVNAILSRGARNERIEANRGRSLVTAFDLATGDSLGGYRGGDGYRVTADIAAEAAARLLAEPPPLAGVQTPAALWGADEFMTAAGLSWVEPD